MSTTLSNPFGIYDPKHWTNRKPTKKSIYQQTVGNPYLRSVATDMLYKQMESARSTGHKKAITNDLRALGQGDYLTLDHGEPPKGAN